MIDTFMDDAPTNLDNAVDTMLQNLVQNRQDLQGVINGAASALGASISANDQQLRPIQSRLGSTITRAVNSGAKQLGTVGSALSGAMQVPIAESAAIINQLMAQMPVTMAPHMPPSPAVRPPPAIQPAPLQPPPGAQIPSYCWQLPNDWMIFCDPPTRRIIAVCQQDGASIHQAIADGWADSPRFPQPSNLTPPGMQGWLYDNLAFLTAIMDSLPHI